MERDRNQADAGDEQRTRCVILTPAGRESERDLNALVHDRQWEPVPVRSPYLAMAQLCIEERLQASRSAWGLQRARGLALLIVQSRSNGSRWEEPLVRAVRKYLPAITIWSYADGAISAIQSPPIEDGAPYGRRPARDTASMAGDVSDDFKPAEITPEEIDMLLARDGDGEERRRG